MNLEIKAVIVTIWIFAGAFAYGFLFFSHIRLGLVRDQKAPSKTARAKEWNVFSTITVAAMIAVLNGYIATFATNEITAQFSSTAHPEKINPAVPSNQLILLVAASFIIPLLGGLLSGWLVNLPLGDPETLDLIRADIDEELSKPHDEGGKAQRFDELTKLTDAAKKKIPAHAFRIDRAMRFEGEVLEAFEQLKKSSGTRSRADEYQQYSALSSAFRRNWRYRWFRHFWFVALGVATSVYLVVGAVIDLIDGQFSFGVGELIFAGLILGASILQFRCRRNLFFKTAVHRFRVLTNQEVNCRDLLSTLGSSIAPVSVALGTHIFRRLRAVFWRTGAPTPK